MCICTANLYIGETIGGFHIMASNQFSKLFQSPFALSIVVLVASLLFLNSCTEYNGPVDANGNLLNPSIKPMVLSTIPPNGAVGPFKEFHATGEISSDMPYFFVQFNKLMAP